jgi:sugar O-acyltransferase (sialic acid O-acetyltransferase NeuD family)
MANFYLVGYSGHAYVVAETILLSKNTLIGYFDLEEKKHNPFQLKYLGRNPESEKNTIDCLYFPCIGKNDIRRKIINELVKYKLAQTIVVHPTATISPSANIFTGSFVSANVVINAMATIMDGCIINTSSIIEHEVFIDSYSHIAPGSVLLGNVKIGSETLVGANTVIREGKTIGSNVIIGAGSVVISDISSNQTWVGNPAKRIK